MDLYTKNGRPLQVSGNIVYSKSGKVVGCIQRDFFWEQMEDMLGQS